MKKSEIIFLTMFFVFGTQAKALDIEKSLQPTILLAQNWASDAVIIKAVKEANINNATKYKDINQDKWTAASIMDALIKDFTKNEAATLLKSTKTAEVTEVFLNAKDGTKVAFLAKTSSWSHAGKPKHETPMSGKIWIGKIEIDDSTGLQQVQFSVPVKEKAKVIGSLVVGVDAGKLK